MVRVELHELDDQVKRGRRGVREQGAPTFGLPRVLQAVEHRRSKGRAHRLDLLLRWSAMGEI